MYAYKLEISLPVIREPIIRIFFRRINSYYGTVGTFGKCKTCCEDVYLEKEKNSLQAHFKLHPAKWNLYLTKLAKAMEPELSQSVNIDALKLATLMVNIDDEKEYFLKLPMSRLSRVRSHLKVNEVLTGFEGRIQKEYESSPVGQYMGSYDQNEVLNLSIQLRDSKLGFDEYTQFRHPDNKSCKYYPVKESYKDFDELKKIYSLLIPWEEDELPYDYEEDRFFVSREAANSWTTFLQPFLYESWAVLMLMLVVMSLIFTFVVRMGKDTSLNEFSLGKCAIYVFGAYGGISVRRWSITPVNISAR